LALAENSKLNLKERNTMNKYKAVLNTSRRFYFKLLLARFEVTGYAALRISYQLKTKIILQLTFAISNPYIYYLLYISILKKNYK
jgi:hypothetical protein